LYMPYIAVMSPLPPEDTVSCLVPRNRFYRLKFVGMMIVLNKAGEIAGIWMRSRLAHVLAGDMTSLLVLLLSISNYTTCFFNATRTGSHAERSLLLLSEVQRSLYSRPMHHLLECSAFQILAAGLSFLSLKRQQVVESFTKSFRAVRAHGTLTPDDFSIRLAIKSWTQ